MSIQIPSFSFNEPYLIQSILQSYAGTHTSTEQQALWTLFLQQNNIQTLPTDSAGIEAINEKFLGFVTNQLLIERGRDAPLSPQAIVQRQLVFQMYQAIITMLVQIQGTVSAQTALILFYAQMQNSYASMQAAVPFLTSGNTTPNPPSVLLNGQPLGASQTLTVADLKNLTVGFNGITLDEIIQSAVSNISNDQPYLINVNGTPTNIGISQGIFALLTPQYQNSGGPFNSLTFQHFSNQLTIVAPGNSNIVVNLSGNPKDIDSDVAHVEQAFITAQNANPTVINSDIGVIQYPSDMAGSSSNAVQLQNAFDQLGTQSITGIQARMQSWSNASNTFQGNLNVSQQATQNQSGILNTTLQTLTQIVRNIA
jgi:hypothetical protein